MYEDEKGIIVIEDDDQCDSCEFFAKGVMCPLLEALHDRVAFLDEPTTVVNCGFYYPFERHLKFV